MAINLSNISQYFQYPSKVAELRDRLYNILKNKGIEVTASESLNSLIEKVREVEPALEPQTIYLTQNNTSYDVTEYTEAIVDVPPVTVENDLDGLIDGSLISFTIPSNISTLASARFSNFTNLSTVIMPDIKDIPDNTFEKCLTLQEITLPNVETIGNYAFKDCYSLSNIIANNVKHIGKSAFYNCTNLTTFDNSYITNLNSSAIYNCLRLSQLNLSNLRYIEIGNLYKCDSLESINLPELISLSSNYQLSYNYNLKNINIPNITSIYANFPTGLLNTDLNWPKLSYLNLQTGGKTNGFKSFINLTSINWNLLKGISGTTNVSYYVFEDCNNLSKIDLPMLNSMAYIKLVKNSPNLTYINLGYTTSLPLTGTHSSAYFIDNCNNLSSIDMSYIKVLPAYFMSNNKITSLNIPYVKSIYTNALSNLTSLSAINGSYLQYIASSAFKNCINLSDIKLDYISYIGSEAFYNCPHLSGSVYMTTTNIEYNAFNGCYNLSDIYLNTVSSVINSINFKAFENCGVLSSSGNIYVPNEMLSSYLSTYSTYPFYSKFKAMTSEYENDRIFAYKYYSNTSLSTIPTEELNKKIIYDYAFYNCSSLNGSYLLSEVEYIGRSAFWSAFRSGNYSNSIDLPKCKTINDYAFGNASSLTISLPEVEYIGEGAFTTNAVAFKSIYMPKVKYIGDYAFSSNRTGIRFLNNTFSNLEYLGTGAFSYARYLYTTSNLISFPILKSINSYAFASIPNGGDLISIYAPQVEYIGEYAFSSFANLTSVTLSNIKIIDTAAFSRCYNLKTVDSLYTCNYISSYAFYSCYNLSLSLSSPNLIKIGEYAFISCSKLTYLSLPELVEIGTATFSNCVSLSTLYAPKIAKLYYGAFYNCYNLRNLSINYDAIESIPDYTFYTCSQLSELNFKYANEVGNRAFYGCTNLSKLVLGSNYTMVNEGTFYNCNNLDFSDIKLDKITYVGNYAFQACSKLSSFNNSYLSSVYDTAFAGCTNLQKVNMPNLEILNNAVFNNCKNLSDININFQAISYIGTEAFSNCNKLKNVYFPNLISIYSGAFYGCSSLTEFNLANTTVINSNVFNGCINLSSIDTSNVTSIRYAAFANCSNLSYLNLNNVISIESAAFQNCTNLDIQVPNLSEVKQYTYYSTAIKYIDNSAISVIETGAFELCRDLSFINLANTYSIGANAFSNCQLLSSVAIPNISFLSNGVFTGTALSEIPEDIDNNLSYINNSMFISCMSLNKVILSKCSIVNESAFYDCKNNTLIDLKMVNYISSLGKNAFASNNSVNSISLPEILDLRSLYVYNSYNKMISEDTSRKIFGCPNVEYIYAPKCSNFASYVFYNNLYYLKSIDIRNCWSIYQDPFTGNTNLESIDIRNMSYAGGFNNCSNLKNINISNVLNINNYAFTNCWSLSEIIAPKANFIGFQAFMNCSKLAKISANYVSVISASAFYNCQLLSNLNINVIEKVSTNAFYNCNKLKSIALTSTTDTFYYCSSLESLYILNTNSNAYGILYPPNQFYSTPMMNSSYLGYFGSIYVPSAVLSYYTTDANLTSLWSRFAELPSNMTSRYVLAYEFSSKSISIADINTNISYILSNAFNNAEFIDFSKLTLPSLKYIGYAGFRGCKSLNDIVINNCNNIGEYAFAECSNLSNIIIPNVYSIGSYAFIGCSKLTTLSLPEVEYVNNLFDTNVTSLSEIYLSKAKIIENLEGLNNLEKIDAPEAIYWKGPTSAKLNYINLPKLSYLLTYNYQNASSGNLCGNQLSSYINYFNIGVSSIYINGHALQNRSYGSLLLSNLITVNDYLLRSVTANYVDLNSAKYLGAYALANASINTLNASNITTLYNNCLRSVKISAGLNLNNVTTIYTDALAYFESSCVTFSKISYMSDYAFRNASIETLKFDQKLYFYYYSYSLRYNNLTNIVFNKGLSFIYTYYNLADSPKLERVVFNGDIDGYYINYDGNGYTVFMNTPMSTSAYLGHYGSIYVPISYLQKYRTIFSTYTSRITTIEEHETELRNLGLID